ncbi:hypothetical protein IJD44_11320 [bacterium]|nr:hypothetical protein [bacterium]
MKKILLISFLLFITIITAGAGYMGTLPDIEAEFNYLRKEKSEKAMPTYSVEELDKQNEQELRTIPRDNENYVDIIIKKDKTTQYLHDVNSVILILEKLRKCINTDGDIQRFNAIVSNLIDNVSYIQEEYKDKPESNYLSYTRIVVVAQEARAVANFRMQGQVSASYMPYTSQSNIYTKENLENRLKSLLNNVNETLFILKNLE